MIKDLKELYHYRQMVVSLVRKELRGRYKGSVLGFMWTFMNPLLQLMVYTIVFSVILQNTTPRYYLFLFSALVPWMFFSASLTGGSSSVLASKDMVKKIYFPREVMPIAYVTSAFVNMALTFLVVMLVMMVSGQPWDKELLLTWGSGWNWFALLYLPIVMIIEYMLALGVAMLSSALTVYFRDLEYILGIISMLWMYMCPILYPISMVTESGLWEKYGALYMLNPMTPIVVAFRDIFYYGRAPELGTLLNAAALGLFFIVFGYLVFRKLQKGFAEEL